MKVFRFFIKTCTVRPPSALAAMVEATSHPGSEPAESGPMTPSSSLASTPSIFSAGSPEPDVVLDLHILIVEDNIINQTVLKRQIFKAGLTCDGKAL